MRIPMLHLENSESLHADCISEDEFKHLLADGTQGYLLRGGAIYGQCSHVEVAPMYPESANTPCYVAAKGAPVEYDRSWTAPNDSYIATLAIGYADGLGRSLSHAPNAAYGKRADLWKLTEARAKSQARCAWIRRYVNMGSTSSDPIAKEGDHAILFGREVHL